MRILGFDELVAYTPLMEAISERLPHTIYVDITAEFVHTTPATININNDPDYEEIHKSVRSNYALRWVVRDQGLTDRQIAKRVIEITTKFFEDIHLTRRDLGGTTMQEALRVTIS